MHNRFPVCHLSNLRLAHQGHALTVQGHAQTWTRCHALFSFRGSREYGLLRGCERQAPYAHECDDLEHAIDLRSVPLAASPGRINACDANMNQYFHCSLIANA